jgi:DNA polymerase gamma 1
MTSTNNHRWYKKLIPPKHTEPVITIRARVVPLLLRMTWRDYPLFYMGTGCGWCFRVPAAEYQEFTHGVALAVDEFEKSVEKQLARSKADPKAASDQKYLDWFNNKGDYVFIRVPVDKHGSANNNCGSIFSKSFLTSFMSGVMNSENPVAKDAIEANVSSGYWISSRTRIMDQFVVWYSDWLGMYEDAYPGDKLPDNHTEHRDIGIILPQMRTMGTVTRRAVEPTWLTASNAKASRLGSELKSLVQAPPRHKFVGADVDSQELWIAGLLGDAQFGTHGATAFGWMTLQGAKADGTDLHSRSAAILKASRDHAKIFNYARIYGSGMKFSAALLRQCNPELSVEVASTRAQNLYSETKGIKWYPPKFWNPRNLTKVAQELFPRLMEPFWFGGSESYMFNQLETTAMSNEPRTPALECKLPDSLMAPTVRKKYQTSCVNWVVQSSGVDYLHMLLVSMQYLSKRFNIDSRLLITIHDEIRYIVAENDATRAAFALQIANLWTRSLFAEQVGMNNLPEVIFYLYTNVMLTMIVCCVFLCR